MNRPLIITIGIVAILGMVGLWAYLLAYGAPEKPREVFTNLGFLTPAPEVAPLVAPEAEDTNDNTVLSLGGAELEQLTTRAVAGFAFIGGGSQRLRYVEKGTGYVFEINLASSTEEQISVTTVPQTAEAIFSPSGERVAITTFEGYDRTVVVGTLSGGSLGELAELPEGAVNLHFKDDEKLLFSLELGKATYGYVMDVNSLERTQVFSIDVPELNVSWSKDGSAYAFTRPSRDLEGYAYKITKNTVTPLPFIGKSLSLFSGNNYITATYLENDAYLTMSLQNDIEQIQHLLMLPEKCLFNPPTTALVWCAAPTETEAGYVEDWYKGSRVSEDLIWLVNLQQQTVQTVADLSKISKRTIDVDGLAINDIGSLMLLRNKMDNALWLYRIPN